MAELTSVFQEVFDDDEVRISRETTAKDIEGWDSLMHVTLLVKIERTFAIKFRSSEVAGIKNVGELVDLIESKLEPALQHPSF
jgi:acyl carrier protein